MVFLDMLPGCRKVNKFTAGGCVFKQKFLQAVFHDGVPVLKSRYVLPAVGRMGCGKQGETVSFFGAGVLEKAGVIDSGEEGHDEWRCCLAAGKLALQWQNC